MVPRLHTRLAASTGVFGMRAYRHAGPLGVLGFLVATLALVFTFPTSAWAEPQQVETEISSKENHGRIVLNFRGRSLLPTHATQIRNGVFIATFEEPFAIDISRVTTELSDYVAVARRDPDGKGVRFALARGIKVNTIEAGERLFIDFLPADWQGLPPNLPADVIAELARRAQEAIKKVEAAERLAEAKRLNAEVTLRVGEHPTFTRLQFDWNLPFENTFERNGSEVTVRFDHWAELDLSSVRSHLPKGVKGIRAENVDAQLMVKLDLADDVDTRAFRDEGAYVVDLMSKEDMPDDPLNTSVRDAMKSGRSGTEQVEAASARPQKSVPPAVLPEPVTQSTQDLPISATSGETPSETPRTAAKNPPKPHVSRGNPEALPKRKHRRAKFIRAEARRIGNTVRIVFPFDKPVAAAVFRRKKSLWLVFDSPVPLDTRSIRSVLDSAADDVVIRRSGPATTVRIDLRDPLLTTIGGDGNSWVITIGDMLIEPSRPLRIVRGTTKKGQSILKVDLEKYASIHQLDDPLVGDRIHVVTALGPPRGLIKTQRFAQLTTLPSAHGIAVVGYTDDFKIHGETPDRLILGRGDDGLSLTIGSAGIGDYLGLKQTSAAARRAGFIELEENTFTPLEFRNRLMSLRNDIATAEDRMRNAARRRLAQFYLTQMMPFEALGVLNAMGDENDQLRKNPVFSIMLAAAQTLAGRPSKALSVLERREFETNPDAALWRTIAAQRNGDWRGAQRAAAVGNKVVGDYPPGLQAEFGLSAAESAIEVNDYGAASAYLTEIAKNGIPKSLAARRNLLRGRVADAAGHSEEALTLYRRAAGANAGALSIEAEYRALRLRYRDGLLPAERIIERLDQIAAGWRGDEIELKVLRFLAQLRVETGDYRHAFEAMKSAVHAMPNSDTARLLQEEMAAVFSSLFLDGKADRMSPIDALSLYYDFREMTPVGRRGDDMVRRLAARLVDVDLLDQASQLLQHQVDNRLKGAARAQIAADLASIYLLDRKPERALAVLSKTRQSLLPGGLDRQRRLVEARAMSETGRVEQAIELVRHLTGSDVGRLRADIYWKADKWQEAGEHLEALNQSRWSDSVPLDERERIDVLKAAIAYSRADDQIGLDRLSAKFTEKMTDSPHARAFEIVTRPISSQGVDFIDVARQIAAVDSHDAFLTEYRRHYMADAGAKSGDDAATPPASERAPQPAATDAAPAAS